MDGRHAGARAGSVIVRRQSAAAGLRKDQQGPGHGAAVNSQLVRDELLHELFEHTVDRHPEAIALECAGEQLSYRELEQRANQLARHLRASGVGPGALVAFQLPRSNAVLITLLAILKTGAAYVPLDPEYPADRVAYIVADCQVHTLVTTGAYAHSADALHCNVLHWEAMQQELSRLSDQRLSRLITQAGPRDLCYIIYTSGSTGRPKGVQVEHRSACHLVRAEGALFHVGSEDRVFHGFSVAFDASVEEIWLAFFSGATLVVGTAETVHDGPALSGVLTRAGVTVLSCVPTLLSMFEEDIPTLRLLIVGGEQCPHDLVCRWARDGRRMVNSYGPTEATVIATYAECLPEKPVTIGIPVPNYQIYLLDEALKPVPDGAPGELFIGGIGLARGYVGRPELTTERFIPNPFGTGRLYRTGDLGRYTPEGEIEFLGRIDGQVKLRGYRIELSEIESALLACPGVRAAAVTVREDQPGIQQLVGYVLPSGSAAIDEDGMKSVLRERLPAYMIPACLECVADFPTLPSGKVDRKRLPAPRSRQREEPLDATERPQTPVEEKLARVWEQFFGVAPISREADFFHDLGGHSLLAARTVSELRKDPVFHDISVLDVYHRPRLCELAAAIAARRDHEAAAGTHASPSSTHCHASNWNFWTCGAAQAGGLYALLSFISLQWLLPYFAYLWMDAQGHAQVWSLLAVLGVLVGLEPLLLLVALAGKWLIIGRYRAGAYPLWGAYYFRWWLVNQLLALAPTHALIGTPLWNGYLRLLGAKVGRGVYIGTDHVGAFDLLTIGNQCSIGLESSLLGYAVADGLLTIAPIMLGTRCYVGARSMLGGQTVMEDSARLDEMSLLPAGGRIPIGETWTGSPARPLPRKPAPERAAAAIPATKRLLINIGHAVGILALPAVTTIALIPGLLVFMAVIARAPRFGFLLAAPLFAILYILTFLAEVVLLKWALLGRVHAGRYALTSLFYVKKRFIDQLMDACLTTLGPLYATLYIAPFFRLLGARLGPAVELSTAHSTTPDLLAMDGGSFVADSVALGVAHVERGLMTLAPVNIGQRTFIGNSAVLPGGTNVGSGGLIGVLSTRPLAKPGAEQPGTAWLGSPAIFLPRRQVNTAFPEETTYKPTKRLYALRLIIEFFRIILPMTCFAVLGWMLFAALDQLLRRVSVPATMLLFPAVYLGCALLACGIVILTKWLLMGRYHPTEKPLWSAFVWRTELLTAMHEHLADPFIVRALLGTPFAAWFFRALGAKIGARVYLETTSLTEFDLVTIEDDAMLNQDCVVQSHLFEDRVMKMSTIHIGARCTVGSRAVVLYDSSMGNGAHLNDLSLVMKGETLPPRVQWIGSPGRAEATARILPPVTLTEQDEPERNALPLPAAPLTVGQGVSG